MAGPSSSGPHEDPWLGRLFAGRYQINDLVASGGMGRVYRAQQRGLERWVALKVLHARLSADETVVKRFYTEMRATARIEHPHTVRVYDFGHTEDGDLFLVMELLRGPTLSDVIDRDAPLSPERVARIGARIARALEGAHRGGVVHRDLKPDNVLITEQYGTPDWVKVLDFGLARVHSDMPQDVTAVGKRVGTPLYMAPEYIEHRKVDERSDLYALGAVLYELATGRVPYEGTAREVLQQQIAESPVAPSVHNADVPGWLDALILSCMRQEPDHRPQTAAEVAAVLEHQANQPTVIIRRAPQRMNWRVFAVAAAIAASIAVAGMSLFILVALIWIGA